MRNLRAGQNADLASERLQFATEPRCAVAVLIVDDGGQALSPDAFVTNNRSAPGVQVQGSAAHIDTAELPEAAARALCIALEPPPGTSLNCCIESDNGGDAASMAVEAASIFPATICFEIYRRAARWKIRAVGQGYQGGRTELLAAYGLAGLAEKSRVAVSEPPVHRDPAASAFPPLGTDNPVERLSMIFEDATRITAAFLSARDFAHSRRDDELSAAVADPRTRNTPQHVRRPTPRSNAITI